MLNSRSQATAVLTFLRPYGGSRTGCSRSVRSSTCSSPGPRLSLLARYEPEFGGRKKNAPKVRLEMILSLMTPHPGIIYLDVTEQLDSDRLSKETLEDDTESAKNVSAVLTAVAFEDLMRRMGSELAGVVGRPLLLVFCIALNSCQSHKANSGPSIEFAHIPPMAQGGGERIDTIAGRVRNAHPRQQIVIDAHSGRRGCSPGRLTSDRDGDRWCRART